MPTLNVKFLFEPSDQITNDGERRVARITSILCFVVFVLRLIDHISFLIFLPQITAIPWPLLFLTPAVFVMYILSRTKYVRFVADGLVWLFFGSVIMIFFAPNNQNSGTLFWLLFPVTLAALLQSVQRTLMVWVVAIISALVLSYLYVEAPFIEVFRPIGLIFVIGLLLLAATSARQRDRTLIEKQTRELEEQKLVLEETNQILEETVAGQSTRLRQSSAELVREKQLHSETELALHRKQRLEGIGLLAGGIAHDFNNLLTGIGGQIALATRKLDSEEAAYKHIRKAAAQVTQTSTITRQLLAYASDNQNTMAELDFRGLIIDMYSFLERVIDKDVKLVHDIRLDSDQPMTVWGDVAQLQQVAMNLIINAADSITEKGARSTSDGTVIISLSNQLLTATDLLLADMLNRDDMRPGKYIRLTIQDSGCGMDAETVSKIFDPFFTTKQTGHGLGLSTVLNILRRHNGGLIVNSKVDLGTTFHVYIPENVSSAICK